MPESSEPTQPAALALFGVTAGPRRGEEIPISSPSVSIGQGPQNDVVLTDDSVSRTHARLEYRIGSWMLTDLESTNGTTVEGVKLAPGVPTPLSYASTVRFGGVQLQFREVENADPETARASFREPEPEEPAGPKRFRLPVWAFVLILLALAAVIFLLVGGAEAAGVAWLPGESAGGAGAEILAGVSGAPAPLP